MNLKPYDPNAKCPKCGQQCVGSSYREAYTSYIIYDDKNKWDKEHIHRNCRICGYDWPEACLDDDSAKWTKEQMNASDDFNR